MPGMNERAVPTRRPLPLGVMARMGTRVSSAQRTTSKGPTAKATR